MNANIALEQVGTDDLSAYKALMRRSFEERVRELFGAPDAAPVPAQEDIDRARGEGADLWHIVADGTRAGGAVVSAAENGKYRLDFLFLAPEAHGKGLGRRAWNAIEAMYPQARVWELYTPCFEKRNIHFYINVCGFRVVEYFNPRHPDPHAPDGEEFFRFEKELMPRQAERQGEDHAG